MMREYNGQTFLTDNDLKVNVLGFWPRIDIQNPRLKKYFKKNFGRDFLGADEVIAYSQVVVSSGVDFSKLEEAILKDTDENSNLKELIFKKTATGIGRGHSLGGLAGVVLGINGTKMIDSGLTGFVMSRSLVTSFRRRETTSEEIVIPEVLFSRQDLLNEYLKISRDVFNEAQKFKDKFGKTKGVETFNKVIAYNNPADLLWEAPLDTLVNLSFEIGNDKFNLDRHFFPKELYNLVEKLPELTKKAGMGITYNQRVEVPRDTYLHYNVFKDPLLPNYPLELAKEKGMPIEPLILEVHKDITRGFREGLKKLEQTFEEAKQITEPEKLNNAAKYCINALHEFTGEYNESIRVKVLDTISWRVWSEQKRHATLKQNVESVYSGADRVYKFIRGIWPEIQRAHETGSNDLPIQEIKKYISIDGRLEKEQELLNSYLYHTARQLMLYGKLIDNCFDRRDALYIVPKNIKLKTIENYDLINLIDLELPLRMCSTCEPERNATSWQKREIIAQAVPEIKYFLQPKCNVGFCTEAKPCQNIFNLRNNYSIDLHNQTKVAMLGEIR